MATQFFFERSEKKYIVDVTTSEQLKTQIAGFLPKEWHKGSDISFVRSVYFDDDTWTSYQDYKTDQKVRFKVRMRQYGIEGVYTNQCFFELKEKMDFMTFKKRLKLKQKWIDHFLEGTDLWEKLVKYNKQMPVNQVMDIYKEIQWYLNQYSLLPTVEVTYQREAFEDEQRFTRITFDRHLSFRALPYVGSEPFELVSMFPTDRAVIEIKTLNQLPDRLKKLCDQFELMSQRFSKYATAVEALFAPELQPVMISVDRKLEERFHGTIC